MAALADFELNSTRTEPLIYPAMLDSEHCSCRSCARFGSARGAGPGQGLAAHNGPFGIAIPTRCRLSEAPTAQCKN